MPAADKTTPWITTIEEALEFVQQVGLCTLFSDQVKGVPSLWNAVDLPDREGGRTKWGAKIEAVWAWKTELPTLYPDDVYYGKIKGGHAALMSMPYFIETHYPQQYRPLAQLRELSQQVFEVIRLNPGTTREIRQIVMEDYPVTKSRFDSAMKELQVSLNITRLNEPGRDQDFWLPLREVYGDVLEEAGCHE